MARYNEVFAALAQRAVDQGAVDAETFMRLAAETGMSERRIFEELARDLETNGPIFGKFLRSITGAAQATVVAAARQGQLMGDLLAAGFRGDDGADAIYEALTGIADGDGESIIQRAIDGADPDLAADIEAASADLLEYTWVATLVNTCHLCLPLHGQTQTLEEWKALGFLPETIHAQQGWGSDCQCNLVPAAIIGRGDREEIMAPLVRTREKLEDKLHGQRKTARAVTQKDLDRALAARDAALQSDEGKRTLKILGTAWGDQGDSDGN
jgi:hypothetical protein